MTFALSAACLAFGCIVGYIAGRLVQGKKDCELVKRELLEPAEREKEKALHDLLDTVERIAEKNKAYTEIKKP